MFCTCKQMTFLSTIRLTCNPTLRAIELYVHPAPTIISSYICYLWSTGFIVLASGNYLENIVRFFRNVHDSKSHELNGQSGIFVF